MKKILFFLILIILFAVITISAFEQTVKDNLSRATENSDNIQNDNSTDEIRVFIKVKEYEKRRFFTRIHVSEEQAKQEIIEEVGKEKVLNDFGYKFSVELNKKEIEKLSNKDGIEEITLVGIRRILLQNSTQIINSSTTNKLQYNNLNLTGKGQTICIIDTGVNYSHPDLGGCYGNNNVSSSCKIIGGWDYYNSDSNPLDDNGHGTHIAGIIAADGSITGVAPEAKIIAIKACDSSGNSCTDDAIAKGIEFCINNKSLFNISIISLSLGSGLYNTYCNEDPLAGYINSATNQNISVVVATGNDRDYASISAPACVESAIPIGSSTKSDTISLFSNSNNLTQLLAPGGTLTGTGSCTSSSTDENRICSTSISGSYIAYSGTSMATPHAAGALAIINQYLALTGRTRTPAEIETLLNNTGKRIQDIGYSELNFSRINLYATILNLDITAPNITLISPENNLRTTDQIINFTCLSSDFLLQNITFYLWNSSSSLIYNETKNITGITNSTLFNQTNLAFDDYNWTCKTTDSKNNYLLSSNSSLSIRRIITSNLTPTNNTFTNHNNTNFTCYSETNNNFNLTNVTFYLWNSSSSLIYNETKNITGITNSTLFNYTLLNEENYKWNCLSKNNNSDSIFALTNYTLVYDLTYPNISLVSPNNSQAYSSNNQEIIFQYNVSDDQAIENCSLIINNQLNLTNYSITNFSQTQDFTQTFSPSTYSWNIICADKANNIVNSSLRSFTITAPPDPPQSSGGGGGGGSATLKIYKANTINTQGYTQTLKEKEKITFEVPIETTYNGNSEGIQTTTIKSNHSLTINKITSSYVNITLRSDPIDFILFKGEQKKINLTSPNYYDLSIRLNSIINNNANITLRIIYEPITIINNQTANLENSANQEKNNFTQKENTNLYIYVLILAIITGTIIYLLLNRSKPKKIHNKKK